MQGPEEKPLRPLVIGGTGFIGLNIVRELRSQGYSVLTTKRPSSNTLFLRKYKSEMVEADCLDLPSLTSVMKRSDVVFMTAGHYPRYSLHGKEQVEYGVKMIKTVLQAAKEAGIRQFVYTSSVTTVKKASNLKGSEEDGIGPPPGHSVYYSVKYAMEKEVLKAIDEGLPGTVLCVAGCLGPLDWKMGTGSLLVHALNQTLPYYLDGKINLIDVEDVAKAHVECMKRSLPRKRYILAHHNTTVGDFLRQLSQKYGVRMPRRMPLWIASPYVKAVERYSFKRKKRPLFPVEFVDMLRYGQDYSVDRAREEVYEYGTTLEETIEKSYDWFKKYKYIRSIQ